MSQEARQSVAEEIGPPGWLRSPRRKRLDGRRASLRRARLAAHRDRALAPRPAAPAAAPIAGSADSPVRHRRSGLRAHGLVLPVRAPGRCSPGAVQCPVRRQRGGQRLLCRLPLAHPAPGRVAERFPLQAPVGAPRSRAEARSSVCSSPMAWPWAWPTPGSSSIPPSLRRPPSRAAWPLSTTPGCSRACLWPSSDRPSANPGPGASPLRSIAAGLSRRPNVRKKGQTNARLRRSRQFHRPGDPQH